MVTSEQNDDDKKPLHVIFIHLDLGIGGAEQLMINLALATLPHKVSIFTTHCNQNHCFKEVCKNGTTPGKLAHSVHVVGQFLPVNIFSKATAFCSTIRMIYLTIMAKWLYPKADVFVLDVLPTSIPFLVYGFKSVKSVIYYCHFPDKWLTKDSVNGICFSSAPRDLSWRKWTQNIYRAFMNHLEEVTMSYADLICVNSNFTREEVIKAFPSIRKKEELGTHDLFVLYPAIDLTKFIQPDFESKIKLVRSSDEGRIGAPIVSLNRFERKKNIEVLLHAYSGIKKKVMEKQNTSNLPRLILAGGFDPRNQENAEYLEDLMNLSVSLDINDDIIFKPSVSDEERALLLRSALCVVYTPFREHFGIVPIEAMYAGSAVIALNSGGPKETVLDEITGLLVDLKPGDSSEPLQRAIEKVLSDPMDAIKMGQNGHDHVKTKFGLEPFHMQWQKLLRRACLNGLLRRKHDDSDSINTAIIIAAVCLVALWHSLII